MTVFVVIEVSENDLTHATLGVFGTLAPAQAAAERRAEAEESGGLVWEHRDGSAFWHAAGDGFDWEISEHTIEG